MHLVDILIGFVTGIISGFGVGGGSLLVLYLTVFAGVDQYTAGGINLLYFTGCAPAALISHIREKRILFRAAGLCLLSGIPLSVIAAIISGNTDTALLQKAFGIVLLYIGIKELLTKNQNKKTVKA